MNSQAIIDETRAMLAAGEIDDAVRFSGEELARADNRWRRAHNEKADHKVLIESVRKVLELTALHAAVLRRANQPDQALGTTLGALMTVAFEDVVEPLAIEMLAIVDGALADLGEYANRLTPESDTEDHIRAIVRYLVSMEYALYNLLKNTGGAVVEAAYCSLKGLLGAVESPMVETPDGPADPLHPLPIMNDLLGRAKVLLDLEG